MYVYAYIYIYIYICMYAKSCYNVKIRSPASLYITVVDV